jgi:hypothetical protein
MRILDALGRIKMTAGGLIVALDPKAAVTIENPSASEYAPMFYAFDAITIQKIHAVVKGTTPSVTWTIRYAPLHTDTGTEVITAGTVTTSEDGVVITTFNNPNIPAGSNVWLETTAKSGTVEWVRVTLQY